jgi:hypothetical protein
LLIIVLHGAVSTAHLDMKKLVPALAASSVLESDIPA